MSLKRTLRKIGGKAKGVVKYGVKQSIKIGRALVGAATGGAIRLGPRGEGGGGYDIDYGQFFPDDAARDGRTRLITTRGQVSYESPQVFAAGGPLDRTVPGGYREAAIANPYTIGATIFAAAGQAYRAWERAMAQEKREQQRLQKKIDDDKKRQKAAADKRAAEDRRVARSIETTAARNRATQASQNIRIQQQTSTNKRLEDAATENRRRYDLERADRQVKEAIERAGRVAAENKAAVQKRAAEIKAENDKIDAELTKKMEAQVAAQKAAQAAKQAKRQKFIDLGTKAVASLLIPKRKERAQEQRPFDFGSIVRSAPIYIGTGGGQVRKKKRRKRKKKRSLTARRRRRVR